ncbi:MAG: hypothetical protein ACI39F_08125 [Acutalibacteraceae bacterium]
MKRVLSVVLALVIIVVSVVCSLSVDADTLDSYTGDSWNTLYRSFNNTKVYTRNIVWTDSSIAVQTSASGSYMYAYCDPTDTTGDLKGSYVEITGVSIPKGTYDVSFTVSSSIALEHLEFYNAEGTLLSSTDEMTSTNRTSTGVLSLDSDMTDITVRAVCDQTQTSGTRFRIGGANIKFVSQNAPSYTSRHFDATRAYAGASATTSGGTTSSLSVSTSEHENCDINTNGQHSAHGVRGLNVDDYVYYKFTDIPTGTYNITDTYYDVSSGKASYDIYVGNSVETLAQTASVTAAGDGGIKTVKSENVTVDTTGILIYAVKFTSGTENDCRTVHFCFNVEQKSATGEPLETTSTVTSATSSTTTTTKATTTTTSTTTTTTTTTAAITSQKFVFLYSDSSSDFTIDTNGHTYGFINDYNNTGMEIKGLSAGQTLTFTSKESFDAGIYSPTLYCRSYSGRAKVNVFINDIQVATALDTSVSNGSHKPFALDSVTLETTGPVVIKFVTTSSGTFYPDDIVFEKTGDADPFIVGAQMKSGASIRLSITNGIRFYTQVDATKIATLIDEGYTVEMGTLIAPKDLIGEDELTLESTFKFIDVKYDGIDSNGQMLYYENGNTFVGSITKIKESSTSWSTTSGNITREFVGRGYVKVTKDGETKVNYADYASNDIANNTRSLQYIANAFKENDPNYSNIDSSYQSLVEVWAAAVK